MLTIVTAVLLGASAQVQLAAPGLTATGLEVERVQFVSEFLAAQVAQNGIGVVTPKELAAALGLERQKQLAGCTESSSCLVELANALGVEGVLMGDLARFANRFVMTVKVVKATSGKAVFVRSFEAKTEEVLLDNLKRVAVELGDELPAAMGHAGGRSGGFSPALVPLVVGAAGVVAGGVLLGLAAGQHAILTGPGPVTRSTADAAVASGQGFQTAGLVSLGVGAGVAVAGGVWWALTRRPAPVSASIGPGSASIVFSGAFP